MEFVIVTGMSGAGKTRAVAALEDAGFYCIDNMPPSMIPKFAEICFQSGGKISRVAFVADSRGANMFERFFEGLEELVNLGYGYKMLFLDASDEVLIKRYKETRRKHPLADSFGGSVSAAIQQERQVLSKLKANSDYVIDTSSLTPAQLKERVLKLFTKADRVALTINIISFGFKYGVPADADLVFDVRFMTNPFYVDELKHLTGLDQPVQDYVLSNQYTKSFIQKLYDMIDFLIPLYIEEGKSYLVIGIGCTGGKHRSVTIAGELFRHITDKIGPCSISHRDIEK